MVRKTLILSILMMVFACLTIGTAVFSSADDLIVESGIGWTKNPYEKVKIVTFEREYDESENEIGVKMGILGDYGQRAIKEDTVDVSDISFTIDLTDFKENCIYDLFIGNSSQCFPGSAGLGINFCIWKKDSHNYVCRVNDGANGNSERDQWSLFGGEKNGYEFSSHTIGIAVKRENGNYKVTFDQSTTVEINGTTVESNLNYDGGEVVKAFIVIGCWGDTSRLMSKFLYYRDAEYERYLPVRKEVADTAQEYANAVNALNASSENVVGQIITAHDKGDLVDLSVLRSGDFLTISEIVGDSYNNLMAFCETLSKENYTALIKRYMSDYEAALEEDVLDLEKLSILRARLMNSGYSFADSTMISVSDRNAIAGRERTAEGKYWALIDKDVVDSVDAYVNAVDNAKSYEDYVNAYVLYNNLDISGATKTTQETLQTRIDAAFNKFTNAQLLEGWTSLESPVAYVKGNGTIGYYSEAKIQGSEENDENIARGESITYDNKLSVYNFEIKFKVSQFASVAGSDGYMFFGLYEKQAVHDGSVASNNKGICIQIRKNGSVLSYELYAMRAVSIVFTNCLKGIYQSECPSDGVITIKLKLMGGNLVTYINGEIPSEFTAIKESECKGMFGTDGLAYLVVGSHATFNDVDSDNIGGWGFSIEAVNNNRPNATDLSIWGEGELVDDTDSSVESNTSSPVESTAKKKGCKNDMAGLPLLSLLMLGAFVVFGRKKQN